MSADHHHKLKIHKHTKINHKHRTFKLAWATISLTSNYTMHEVNIAHIMEGDCFISIFSQRDQICPVRTMKKTPVTLKTTNIVKYTALPDKIYTFFIIIFHNNIGKCLESWDKELYNNPSRFLV